MWDSGRGEGMRLGGFDLEVVPGQEEGSRRVEDVGAGFEGPASGLELPIGAHGDRFPVIP